MTGQNLLSTVLKQASFFGKFGCGKKLQYYVVVTKAKGFEKLLDPQEKDKTSKKEDVVEKVEE